MSLQRYKREFSRNCLFYFFNFFPQSFVWQDGALLSLSLALQLLSCPSLSQILTCFPFGRSPCLSWDDTRSCCSLSSTPWFYPAYGWLSLLFLGQGGCLLLPTLALAGLLGACKRGDSQVPHVRLPSAGQRRRPSAVFRGPAELRFMWSYLLTLLERAEVCIFFYRPFQFIVCVSK